MRSPLSIALACVALLAFPAARANDTRRIDIGRSIYVAQCAACHGARGEGQPQWQRLSAAGEMPAPPHDRSGHTWKHSDVMLYRIVADGWRDPFNKTDRLTMPPFGDTLSPAEIRDVLDYLKMRWTPQQREFQREESRKAPYPFPAAPPACGTSHANHTERNHR
jgi:mono/diheme cytochrome c family protein